MAKQGKGSAFEREICKQLSLWWTADDENGPRDDIFWRTAGSGARATTRGRRNIKTAGAAGDLMATDVSGKPFEKYFLCELKCGYSKDIDPLAIVDSAKGTSLLLQWWRKAEKERVFTGRHLTMLIFKRNFKSTCVMVNLHGIMDLLNITRRDFLLTYNGMVIQNTWLIAPLNVFLQSPASTLKTRIIKQMVDAAKEDVDD